MMKILENLVARPGLYWGNSSNHFQSLVAFVSGYQLAAASKPMAHGEEPDAIIPTDFSEFVADYFGDASSISSPKWHTLIEERTKSPSAAMEMFLKLRRLYDEIHHRKTAFASTLS